MQMSPTFFTPRHESPPVNPNVESIMALVKRLDDRASPGPRMPKLIDHIGFDLWQAAHRWKGEFDAAMVDEGYPWFRDARSRVLSVLDFKGTAQADVVVRLGMTKQAVQQLLDQLVDDGILERQEDETDRRGRILVFTAAGARLMADANRVKLRLARAYRRKLGDVTFEALSSALKRLNDM